MGPISTHGRGDMGICYGGDEYLIEGERMANLEDEILSIEERASAVVAAARLEAKKLLGTLENRKKRLAEEIAERTEAEARRLREEYARRLSEKLSEIRREQAQEIQAIEEAQKKKAPGCVRAIMKMLLGG
jgi:DNA repair exonuclease SbcCD ATPase subunit